MGGWRRGGEKSGENETYLMTKGKQRFEFLVSVDELDDFTFNRIKPNTCVAIRQ